MTELRDILEGMQRLQPHELARGLGAKTLDAKTKTIQVESSTLVFLWSYLLEGLWDCWGRTSKAGLLSLDPTPGLHGGVPKENTNVCTVVVVMSVLVWPLRWLLYDGTVIHYHRTVQDLIHQTVIWVLSSTSLSLHYSTSIAFIVLKRESVSQKIFDQAPLLSWRRSRLFENRCGLQ